MPLADLSDPEAVRDAARRYDQLGVEGIHEAYGFSEARYLVAIVDGKEYPSKGLAGVAYQIQFPDRPSLREEPGEYSGGEATVARKLRELGFEVVDKRGGITTERQKYQMPTWSRDEVVLALDVYRRFGMLDKKDEAVVGLSSTLKELTPLQQQIDPVLFRNPAGVAMKLANLAFLDPDQAGGLDAVSEMDRRVWSEYSDNLQGLAAEAARIKESVPERKYWASLANPRIYRIDEALKVQSSGWWGTKGSKISIGDRVLVWRSMGGDRHRGAVALGEVEAGPESRMNTEDEFWVSLPEEAEDRVLVRYVIPEGLPLWVGEPSLDALQLSVANAHGGSVFKMTRGQWEGVLGAIRENRTARKQSNLSISTNKPWYLVLKWRSTSEPATVTKHKEIADAGGSVWWGAFGKPGGRWLSAKRVEQLRGQIASGVPTYAFLYGGGQEWRARLQAMEENPDRIDLRRFPDYYRVEDCAFFVELSDFVQLSPGWAASHLVLARSPDPERMPGALANQTNPLFVIELERSVEPPPARTLEWLRQETLWPLDALEELVAALEDLDGRQIVLAGPPGTGKTWLAKKLAEFVSRGRSAAYRIVQFHPSYSYEDFIEGLRPTVAEGAISFERVDGIVLEMVRQIENETQIHMLLIDEMNRANLPRVFGELMYLFEYRGESVDLRYTRGFELPKNLRFVGTMNTADRSIRSIDVALRRRFDVFECEPSGEILRAFYETRTNEVADLVEGFESLNARLTQLLDRHHTIGHTFFMADMMTPQRLAQVWQRQIAPLVEEYFFDQPDVAASLNPADLWGNFGA